MRYVFRKKLYALAAAAVDAIGSPLARVFRGKTARPVRAGSVLLVRLDHIGDVLAASGIPKLIKENLPSSRVSFLTSAAGSAILQNNPFIDELIVYDAPWFARKRARRSQASRIGFLGLRRLLHKRRFDVAFSLRGDVREHLLLALSGIPQRIGFGITGGGFLLTHPVGYRADAHETVRARDLLAAIGIQTQKIEPRIYITAEEREIFSRRLERLGFPARGGLIGFQVDAGTQAKQWPLEHARAFLDAYCARTGARVVVLVGADAERGKLLAGPGRFDLTGQTSVRELCLVTERFAAFIGPDSGPSHLASAMGLPVFFLYSGTNSYPTWRPLSERAVVLRHEVPCSPCDRVRCPIKGHPCMERILPEELLKAVDVGLPA